MCHTREVSTALAAIDCDGFPNCVITPNDANCVVYTKYRQGVPVEKKKQFFSQQYEDFIRILLKKKTPLLSIELFHR